MCEQVVTFDVQLKSSVSFESFETSLLEAVGVQSNWRVPEYTEGFRFAVNPVDRPATITFSEICAPNSGAEIVLTFNDPADASKYAAFGPTHGADLCRIAFHCGACAVSYGRPLESIATVQVDPPPAEASLEDFIQTVANESTK